MEKGFTQEYGIDYEETFALVTRLTYVSSLIVVVAIKRWQLFQMDVKNAFLNGNLYEEVYVQPPLGYNHPHGKVCHIPKPSMDLSMLLEHGLPNLTPLLVSLDFSLALMITHF